MVPGALFLGEDDLVAPAASVASNPPPLGRSASAAGASAYAFLPNHLQFD